MKAVKLSLLKKLPQPSPGAEISPRMGLRAGFFQGSQRMTDPPPTATPTSTSTVTATPTTSSSYELYLPIIVKRYRESNMLASQQNVVSDLIREEMAI